MAVKRKGIIRWSVVFVVQVLILFSCTYDYFEDENNFRLYIPQIVDGSIRNLYVSFHDEGGNHRITREIQYPFDKDELMKQGILRFKLYPGKYNISCFADYTPGSITVGNDFGSSSKNKDVIDLDNNIYESRQANPRAVLSTIKVYPIGHPNAKETLEVDMNEQRRFKSRVRFVINNLPDIITQIDVLYKGLATRYLFDGNFTSFSPNDQIKLSVNVADYRSGNVVDLTDIINPSIGASFGLVDLLQTKGGTVSPTPMSFTMIFYDNNKNIIGTTYFDSETLQGLANDKRPVDANGVPVSDLILAPQSLIRFTIKDFVIISIELVGWGDTNQGEITPL